MRLRRPAALAGALLLAIGIAGALAQSVSYPPPPVRTVNGQQGDIVVPADCVQRNNLIAVSTVDGSVSWTFPNASCAFTDATKIGCYVGLSQTDTTYVFGFPVQTALDTTHVAYSVQAAKKALTIGALGLINIWAAPPANTTMNVVCRAPMS